MRVQHGGFGVHHVCTENANVDDLASNRSGHYPRKTNIRRLARAKFSSWPNPLLERLGQKRLTK